MNAYTPAVLPDVQAPVKTPHAAVGSDKARSAECKAHLTCIYCSSERLPAVMPTGSCWQGRAAAPGRVPKVLCISGRLSVYLLGLLTCLICQRHLCSLCSTVILWCSPRRFVLTKYDTAASHSTFDCLQVAIAPLPYVSLVMQPKMTC